MTTYPQSRSRTAPLAPEPPAPVAGTRSRHRAQGWLFAVCGAAVLWTAIIGAAFALLD